MGPEQTSNTGGSVGEKNEPRSEQESRFRVKREQNQARLFSKGASLCSDTGELTA